MRFKPRLRDTVAANVAALKAMGGDAPLPADLQRTLDAMPLPKRRQSATDIDRVHRKQKPRAPDDILEDPIQDAIIDLLKVHPRVLFAVRQNTGSASYKAKTGEWAPVKFYYFVRAQEYMTIPDIWGLLRDGRFFTCEVKRSLWTKPTDERERRQAAFIRSVQSVGGIALFATSAAQVEEALR